MKLLKTVLLVIVLAGIFAGPVLAGSRMYQTKIHIVQSGERYAEDVAKLYPGKGIVRWRAGKAIFLKKGDLLGFGERLLVTHTNSSKAIYPTVRKTKIPAAIDILPGHHVVQEGESIEDIQKKYPEKLIIREYRNGPFVIMDSKTISPKGKYQSPIKGEWLFISVQKFSGSPFVFNPKKSKSVSTGGDFSSNLPELKKSSVDYTEEKGFSRMETNWQKALKEANLGLGLQVGTDYDDGPEDNTERSSWEISVKGNMKPWRIRTEMGKVKIGPEFRGYLGTSTTEKPGKSKKDYDSWRAEFGVIAQLKDDQDRTFTGGMTVSHQETRLDGTSDGQNTQSLHLRGSYESDHRRQSGENWFGHHEFSLEWRLPFATQVKGNAKKYDEGKTVLYGRSGVYDWYFDGTRFTFEVLGKLGWYNGKDSWAAGIGPGFSIGNLDDDWGRVSFTPVKFFDNPGASRKEWGLFLDIDAIAGEIEAAGVHSYEGDLKAGESNGGNDDRKEKEDLYKGP